MKTSIATILYQELGQGDVENSHERLYFSTMEMAGFTQEYILSPERLLATKNLVEGYSESSYDPYRGLGFLLGTEATDLLMVSNIGDVIRRYRLYILRSPCRRPYP